MDELQQRVPPFEPQLVLDAVAAALSSESTWEIAAAITLLTVRRPTEILKSAEFKQAGSYQLAFSGQPKQRDNEGATASRFAAW